MRLKEIAGAGEGLALKQHLEDVVSDEDDDGDGDGGGGGDGGKSDGKGDGDSEVFSDALDDTESSMAKSSSTMAPKHGGT